MQYSVQISHQGWTVTFKKNGVGTAIDGIMDSNITPGLDKSRLLPHMCPYGKIAATNMDFFPKVTSTGPEMAQTHMYI